MSKARVLPVRGSPLSHTPNFNSSSFSFSLTSHLQRHHHSNTGSSNHLPHFHHHRHHHPVFSPPSSSQHLFHNRSSSSSSSSAMDNPNSNPNPNPNPRHAKTAAAADEEEWKNRPPYRTTPSSDKKPKPKKQRYYTARCHCGRVRYWLSRDRPLAAKFCHCVDCQALHGAPFQWAAIFDKADLHFEPGAVDGLAFYHAAAREPGYHLPVKVSCATCHAPIMDEGRRMVLMFPAIIEFGDAEHKKYFDPQCHIFYSQRVVDLPDGKPKWTGLDGTSELMKDVDAQEMESVVGKREVETVDQ